MAAHYVEIDSNAFEVFLREQGFSRTVQCDEIVYIKPYSGKDHVVVKCYTSIKDGSANARDVGRDAIRIVAIFDDGEKSFGLYKGARVHRTTSQESVHARTMSRIGEAFTRCKEWTQDQAAARTPKPTTQAQLPNGQHVGNVGDTLRLHVKVVKRKPWMQKFLFTMKTKDDNTFIYWSDKDLLQEQEYYNLRCVVKGHNTFCGVRQTEIKDCVGKRVMM